jgi:hypothetical protein
MNGLVIMAQFCALSHISIHGTYQYPEYNLLILMTKRHFVPYGNPGSKIANIILLV